jgi:microcystin-dependent protein
MSYTPTNWQDNSAPFINSTNLNHLEQGVEDAHTGLDEKADSDDVTTALTGKSDTSHVHDERYYTETEVDVLLGGISIDDLTDVDTVTDPPNLSEVLTWDGASWVPGSPGGGGGGVTDHGLLTGLADDDHSQYHNNTRGDLRYYQKTEVDSAIAAHVDDATDAHDASAISVLDSANNFAGADVEAVLAEIAAKLVPAGAVTEYAGSSAPSGYLLCNGAAVSRTTYAALYSALGGASSPWGQGDGSTTFNVPDMRGRAPIGAGQGTGLTNRTLAAQVGEETHTLSTGEMPAHTHSTGFTRVTTTAGGGSQDRLSAAGTDVNITSSSAGSGGAHQNMQPSVALNFIVKT